MDVDMDGTAGMRVLHESVLAASEVLGESLEAAFTLGSLAHGGFATLVSDVDIALVLANLSADTDSDIDKISSLVKARYPGTFAERLSIFWTDWEGVFRGTGSLGRLPAVDRRDLIESGRLLHGTDRRTQATSPDTHELVINGAEFAVGKFDAQYLAVVRNPGRLLAEGVRATTKVVLFPVRFMYTLSTERIGRNDEAAAWYSRTGAAPALAQAALMWRRQGIDNPGHAQLLLSEHLVPMYLEFFDAYIEAVTAVGRADLTRELQQRRARLAATPKET